MSGSTAGIAAVEGIHQSLSRCVKALHQLRCVDQLWGEEHFADCHAALETVLQKTEIAARRLQNGTES